MKVPPSRIHRLFYPQVPLVLCASHGGRVSAMPVVAYAMVSDAPPLIAVSCSPKAFTCKLATRARAFTLCLLESQKILWMQKLATISGAKVENKLKEVGIKYQLGLTVNAPFIVDSVAVLECALRSSRRVGDHVLLLGDIRASRAIDDFGDFWSFRNYKPILYTGWMNGMTTFGR